ncbi:MAG: SAM-dependent methyltransferase, partial [Thermoflexales bacterium]
MDRNRSASLHRTRTFFTSRAADWEERFADDAPQFERGVGGGKIPPGAMVLELGFGKGRAI